MAIRATVEELALSGRSSESAGSFTLSYDRNNSRLDGVKTRTSTTMVDGAVGLRLSSADTRSGAIAYADYAYRRVRVRTRPAPPMPQEQGGDDVDALELGLLGSLYFAQGQTPSFWLTGRAGVVFDGSTNSRRLAGGLRLTPIFGGRSIPGFRPCLWGGLGEIDVGLFKFNARCDISLIAEGAHVLRTGRAMFGRADDFLTAGGQFSYRIAPLYGQGSGPVGAAIFTYLPVIAGDVPDLSSIDTSIGYRWWVGKPLAIDIKAGYRTGVERKSLRHEEAWILGFGLLF